MIIALAGILPTSVPAQVRNPVSATVPFELYKGHIFVSAYVNGKGPYRFGFDTGASGDGRADLRLTQVLSLPTVGQSETSDGIKTATAQLVSVKSLRLGPVEKHDIQILSRDYNGRSGNEHTIMGIIARDFVAGWLVTIDYPRRTIRFRHGHLREGDAGVVAYGPGFSIPVCFNSGCFPGKVDTGSSRSIVVPKDLAAKLSATPPFEIGQAKRMNSSARLYGMSLKEPVRIAGLKVDGQEVLYADPSDTTINIGSDFLKDYMLTVDQQRQLLSIKRP
jgi:predicted aspartyl protease